MEAKIFTHIDTACNPGTDDGPMAGTRVGVDPNISVENWPTEASSPALKNYLALEDATPVSRLKTQGAHIRGRTTMGELGLGLDRDTGADALNQGMLDLVLKSDTAGEARVIAGAGGCFGFKPSYGLVSRFGLMGLVPSMECCGILSPDLGTLTQGVRSMAGPDERDPSMDPDEAALALEQFDRTWGDHPVTLGVVDLSVFKMDSQTARSFEGAQKRLESAGIPIKNVIVKDLGIAGTVHNIIGSVEASSSAGRFDSVRYGHRTQASAKNWNEMYIKSREESFGPLVKAYLFQGGYFQYKSYPAFLDACRIRARLMESVEKAFGAVDLILMPLCPDIEKAILRPETISAFYDTFAYTLIANLTGHPSLSIPGPDNGHGPALQLVGPRFADAKLLGLGGRISQIHSQKI